MAENMRRGAASDLEEALVECLKETDLESFQAKISRVQLTRLEHFDHVNDVELQSLVGLSLPASRRLRTAIEEKKKKSKKMRNLFGTLGKTKEKSRPKTQTNFFVEKPPSKDEGTDTTCLIAKEQIKIQEKLGEGSFAIVKRALWSQTSGRKVPVAVKLLRESDGGIAEELQLEINNMHKLKHPNLIRLFGLVFATPVMMVVELCEGGALVDRLRETTKLVLLSSQLMDYSVQIAKGMAYLETKRFIHRDLAARNVLLTLDERHVKIGDFGLMRALPDHDEHYVMSAQKKVPFAWCPPESLRRRQFSHASDVWSFGVTLWEIFTYGEEPWCGYRGPEILHKLSNDERLTEPTCCPVDLYQLMLQCWATDPEKRPRLLHLKDMLKELQLPFGECREQQSGEGLLDLIVGDRIIVIKGSPEQYYWYGQNVRTRKYGKFARKILVFRGRESQRFDISKPISGSFIHAGHGDARGGDSWGHPDKIDEIYLKNPMPLIEIGPSNDDSGIKLRVEDSPRIVDSILDRKSAPPLRPPPPSARQRSSELLQKELVSRSSSNTTYQRSGDVDPFAPFDEYDDQFYDVAPSTSTITPVPSIPTPERTVPSQRPVYYAPPVNDLYDDTGLNSVGFESSNESEHSSVPDDPNPKGLNLVREPSPDISRVRPLASASSSNLELQTNQVMRPQSYAGMGTWPKTEFAEVRKVNGPSNEPDPFEVPTAVKQLATRPRYSQMYNTTVPPVLAPTPVTSSSTYSVQQTPPQRPRAITQPMSAVVEPIRPRPHFDLSNQRPDAFSQPTAAVGSAIPRPHFDLSNQRPDAFSQPTAAVGSAIPRPRFEVANQRADAFSQAMKTAEPLSSRPRPLFDLANQRSNTGQSGITGQMVSQMSSNLQNMNLVAAAPRFHTPVTSINNIPTNFTPRYDIRNTLVSLAKPPGAPAQPQRQPMTSYGVPTYSAQHSPSVLVPQRTGPSPTQSLTPPSLLDQSRISSSVPNITKTSPQPEVLNLFDPLTSKPADDLVIQVSSACPFCSKDRCTVVLRRCKNDVSQAIRELKCEKLVDMGLVSSRSAAVQALDKVKWDVNAAIDALFQ